MPTDRELQLEQALIAVIASSELLGCNIDFLCNRAIGGIIGGVEFANIPEAHVQSVIDEIERAKAASKCSIDAAIQQG